ncbi:TasA family protein [Geodermatophilus sp. CPCC 206100]|uniref:TasA family protein n=1 Tax=Geodermatophilus sp. CPCC 206100 TaxID=3020054 RepID=UPI003B00AF11
MKKIALAAAAMGGTALIAFGASGTFAAFTAQTATGSTAGAGTLLVGAEGTASTTATVDDMVPGETQVLPFFVQNTGTGINGLLTGSIGKVDNLEGDCLQPEKDAGDDCGTGKGVGEFGEAVNVKIGYAAAADAAACTETTVPTTGLSTLPTGKVTLFPFSVTRDGLLRNAAFPTFAQPTVVSKDQGACVLVSIQLPTGATNVVQGDQATFEIKVNLAQDTRPSAA